MDLEGPLKTMSLQHVARIKNASIKHAINLVYKYKARSISELYDTCTNEEWANLIYLCNTDYHSKIEVALNLYIKDNLSLQRRNRWEWLISFNSYLPTEENELLRLFETQKINPEVFAYTLHDLLVSQRDTTDCKRNTIKLWGTPDSGKSLIGRLIVKFFICSYNSNHGSEQPFHFSNFLNKSIVLCDELFITTATVEDYKCILGGEPLDIDKKFHNMQLLSRTPIVITSNFRLFGRGHLPPVDEEALTARCHLYHFMNKFKPRVSISAHAFAHLMSWLYNKDMLD